VLATYSAFTKALA